MTTAASPASAPRRAVKAGVIPPGTSRPLALSPVPNLDPPRRPADTEAADRRHEFAEMGEAPSKVPNMTVYFWIVKIITTALGEAVSDYLVNAISPEVAVVIGFVGFAAAMALQFRVRTYVAGVYWLAALMVSIFGTMAADVAHVGLGIPYAVSAVICASALVVVFVVWNRYEGTLSIHSITTPRREAFYWATALVTFALGTAAGDLTAYTFHLGFLTSGIIFICVFAVPAVAFGLFKLNAVLAFWFAYIVTRPLGASFADWGAKPAKVRGRGYGDGPVSLVLVLALIGFVVYLAASHVDDPARSSPPVAPG